MIDPSTVRPDEVTGGCIGTFIKAIHDWISLTALLSLARISEVLTSAKRIQVSLSCTNSRDSGTD